MHLNSTSHSVQHRDNPLKPTTYLATAPRTPPAAISSVPRATRARAATAPPTRSCDPTCTRGAFRNWKISAKRRAPERRVKPTNLQAAARSTREKVSVGMQKRTKTSEVRRCFAPESSGGGARRGEAVARGSFGAVWFLGVRDV